MLKATKILPSNIFYMQQLLLDKKDQGKLKKATVGLAGIGGIGSFSLELLARNGIMNFKLADFDIYEANNTRQLFVTQKTLGKQKALIAKKRVLEINPLARIKVYKEGITSKNYMDFCKGVDIICAQTDRISSQILLYLGAYSNRVLLLHAGRAKWPNKHLVSISVYDFRKTTGDFDIKILGINPLQWGVDRIDLLEMLLARAKERKNCDEIIRKIDSQNKSFRQTSFLRALRTKQISEVSDKSRKYLLKIAKNHPSNFYKMAIAPELCSISGALVATTVKDLILGRPIKHLGIDLYNGKTYDNFLNN